MYQTYIAVIDKNICALIITRHHELGCRCNVAELLSHKTPGASHTSQGPQKQHEIINKNQRAFTSPLYLLRFRLPDLWSRL